jgi:hypothetical protein
MLVGASGCSGTTDAGDSLSGKVTLGPDPVSGTVVLVTGDGKEVPTTLKVDGTYLFTKPPVGHVKILVRSMNTGLPSTAPPKDAPAMPKLGGVAPPPKYADAKTSNLSYDIKPGKQTYDIPLEK